MIEGFVQLQKVTQYSSSWRNCWMRIDDRSIHLFYRPNCPPRSVKANKVRRRVDSVMRRRCRSPTARR